MQPQLFRGVWRRTPASVVPPHCQSLYCVRLTCTNGRKRLGAGGLTVSDCRRLSVFLNFLCPVCAPEVILPVRVAATQVYRPLMGFTFRKRIKLPGGLRVNLSSKGVGLSGGNRGARYSSRSGGRLTIPGTGLSWRGKRRR